MTDTPSAPAFSRLGLGTSRLGSRRANLSARQVVPLLEAAWAAGITFIDTADSYCCGRSEELVGQALRLTGLPFQILTKAGYTFVRLPGALAPLNNRAQALLHRLGYRENYRPDRIAACLEGSLQRLQTGQVAAFFLHRPALSDVENPALLRTLESARSAGKTLRLGLSSDDPAVLAQGLQSGVFDLLQTSVHGLITPEARALIGRWAALGHGVIGHSVHFCRHPSPGEPAGARELRAQAEASGEAAGWFIRQALRVPGVSSVLSGSLNASHLAANARAAAPFLS